MRVEVGQIVNTHGIKGEIKVKSNSDFTDVRFQPGQVLTVVHNNNDLEYTVKSHRVHKGLHMLTFEGINNINDIEHLKGSSIYQERSWRYRTWGKWILLFRYYRMYSFDDRNTNRSCN